MRFDWNEMWFVLGVLLGVIAVSCLMVYGILVAPGWMAAGAAALGTVLS